MFTFFEYTDSNGNIVEVYTGLTKLAWIQSNELIKQEELKAIAEQEGVEPEDLFVSFKRDYK